MRELVALKQSHLNVHEVSAGSGGASVRSAAGGCSAAPGPHRGLLQAVARLDATCALVDCCHQLLL